MQLSDPPFAQSRDRTGAVSNSWSCRLLPPARPRAQNIEVLSQAGTSKFTILSVLYIDIDRHCLSVHHGCGRYCLSVHHGSTTSVMNAVARTHVSKHFFRGLPLARQRQRRVPCTFQRPQTVLATAIYTPFLHGKIMVMVSKQTK